MGEKSKTKYSDFVKILYHKNHQISVVRHMNLKLTRKIIKVSSWNTFVRLQLITTEPNSSIHQKILTYRVVIVTPQNQVNETVRSKKVQLLEEKGFREIKAKVSHQKCSAFNFQHAPKNSKYIVCYIRESIAWNDDKDIKSGTKP